MAFELYFQGVISLSPWIQRWGTGATGCSDVDMWTCYPAPGACISCICIKLVLAAGINSITFDSQHQHRITAFLHCPAQLRVALLILRLGAGVLVTLLCHNITQQTVYGENIKRYNEA